MTPLASLLQALRLTEFPVSDIRTALLRSEYKRYDQTRYSYQGLVAHPKFGATKSTIVLSVLRQLFDHPQIGELARAEYAAFGIPSEDGKTGGLDFSEPFRNQSIRDIAAATAQAGDDQSLYVASVLVELADYAGRTAPVWQLHNLESEPTEQTIQDALDEIASPSTKTFSDGLRGKLIDVRNMAALLAQPAFGPIEDAYNQQATLAEMKAMVPVADVDALIVKLQDLKTSLA